MQNTEYTDPQNEHLQNVRRPYRPQDFNFVQMSRSANEETIYTVYRILFAGRVRYTLRKRQTDRQRERLPYLITLYVPPYMYVNSLLISATPPRSLPDEIIASLFSDRLNYVYVNNLTQPNGNVGMF